MGVPVPDDVVEQLASGHMPAPLVRTDFSDDHAWNELLRQAARPYPPDDFQATLQPVSDERLSGLEASDLVGLDPGIFTVYLADTEALTEPERTVLVVDARRVPVRSFRVSLPALASVENNLTIANMDFDDFARAVDRDGVFRGFAPSAGGEPHSRPTVRPAFARPLPDRPMTAPSVPRLRSGSTATGSFARIEPAPPDAAAARRTLERMRADAIEQRRPHYDLLRMAFPSSPEYEERAALLAVMLHTLPPADIAVLFRLAYDESIGDVQRQVELVTAGAVIDPNTIAEVAERLRSVGWPGA